MKLAFSWLEEYLANPIALKPAELAERISITLTEAEGIEPIGAELSNIVAGKVLAQKAHPDSKKLSVVTVDINDGKQYTILHGASNVSEGDIVPVALPGGFIYSSKQPLGSQDVIEIKAKKMGSITSNGMLCSLKELGIGEDHSGIFILPDDVQPGDNIAIQIKDTILEIENKHLTHRADCFSHQGIAREISAMSHNPFHINLHAGNTLNQREEIPFQVKVEDQVLCPRFTAVVMKGIKVKPSPLWLQLKLMKVGLRPINNVVDITNYVMIDHGQPLHAFDYEALDGGKLIVRHAKKEETLLTLDGEQRTLNENMLVVADKKKAVSLAGIMGGKNSEITDTTKTVVIEGANWEMYNNRTTTRTLGLRTDASTRFEKGLDPNSTLPAVERVATLIGEIAGGEVASAIVDVYPKPVAPLLLEFDLPLVKRLIGIDITKTDVMTILESLGMKIVEPEKSLNSITIEIPTFRNDISIKEDIIEEIARIYGYDKLTVTLPKRDLTPAPINALREFIKLSKETISALGLNEIYTYIFVGKELYENSLLNIDDCIKMQNPVSPELGYIRNSLVPSILEKVSLNSNQFDSFGLFEISKISYKDQKDDEGLPKQEYKIVAAVMDKNDSLDASYARIKNIYDLLLKKLHISSTTIDHIANQKQEQKKYPYLHPGRSGIIQLNGSQIGHIGVVHPLVSRNFDLSYPSSILVLDLDTILNEYNSLKPSYERLPQFQFVTRDVAFIVKTEITADQLLQAVSLADKEHIHDAQIFDIYHNPKLKNEKSIAIRIIINPLDKTLTEAQISKIIKACIDQAKRQCNARVRH